MKNLRFFTALATTTLIAVGPLAISSANAGALQDITSKGEIRVSIDAAAPFSTRRRG